jgi:hypothetical protein
MVPCMLEALYVSFHSVDKAEEQTKEQMEGQMN